MRVEGGNLALGRFLKFFGIFKFTGIKVDGSDTRLYWVVYLELEFFGMKAGRFDLSY